MTSDYSCPNCGETIEVKFSIKDGPPKQVLCNKCNHSMERIWAANIQVPEWFGDDTTSTISERMKHSRPTGRGKLIY